MIRADASQVYKLSTDLNAVGFKMVPALRQAMDQAGRVFADEWRKNAVETSGTHGKHYPKSIDSELTSSITSVNVEVGPNKAKRQGGMGAGFEFGSENQPPHLDGLRALDVIGPAVEDLAAAVVGGTFVANTPAANPLREYTTRAGVTRLATEAQIANWTRGSR